MVRIFLSIFLLMMASQGYGQGNDSLWVEHAGVHEVNGLYTFQGYNEGRPWYRNGNHHILYSSTTGSSPQWVILLDSLIPVYKNFDPGNVVPQCYWSLTYVSPSCMPLPMVMASNNQTVIYPGAVTAFFHEYDGNGLLENTMGDTLYMVLPQESGRVFSGSNYQDFISEGKVLLPGLPSGLIPSLVRINDSTLAFTLSGQATEHCSVNNTIVNFHFLPTSVSPQYNTIVSPCFAGLVFDFTGPAITGINSTFYESPQNNGSVGNLPPHYFHLNRFENASFAGTDGEDFFLTGRASIIGNILALHPELIRINDTLLLLNMWDEAYLHESTNSFYFTVQLNSQAYTSHQAYCVSGSARSFFVSFTNGVTEVKEEKSNNYILYPNPATNSITLSSNSSAPLLRATLYNTFGEAISTLNFSGSGNTTIPLHSISNGMYLLIIEDGNGISRLSFIKE